MFPNPEAVRLIPSCKALLRSMLIKRTLSRICGSAGGTSTSSRLTTLPAVEAIFTARDELLRSLTLPLRKTESPSTVIFTDCPGSSVLSSRRTASSLSFAKEALARTVTLKNCRPPCLSQIIRLVSPGALPFTMTSVRVTACTSATSPKPTATRAMGLARSTKTVFPTAT